jgi:hypothetical protein
MPQSPEDMPGGKTAGMPDTRDAEEGVSIADLQSTLYAFLARARNADNAAMRYPTLKVPWPSRVNQGSAAAKPAVSLTACGVET